MKNLNKTNKKSIIGGQCPHVQRAFTLVELLVVIAFISIMSAVVLISYSNSRNQRAVEMEARKVAAAIREAQNDALTGKGIIATCTSVNLTFPSATTYSIAGNIAGCISPAVYYQLINGVTFTASDPISFSVPVGNVTIITGKIVLHKGSSDYTVCVSLVGNVAEKIGNVACP
jgi:prepilin-type N-terminal cleavage/methylation domain-containing protein